MSSRASKRVSFSPDVNDKPPVFVKHGGSKKLGGSRRRVSVGIFSFRVPKSSEFSPGSFLRRLGAKMARTRCFLSTPKRSSCKVSSSTLQRSRSLADSIDSHRTEAIEDCIEFLNTSSSISRSNSVSASSC
ncbi:josephin-like protein [Mangifera indica]|uniref:josephin-like protein n=1 Tax=Mangifera indica TaxID=29780 RepID=UPI001CF9A599|nr:josephin-like protein [Mangifera indica]